MDNIGNPLTYYNGYTFSWEMGRQLAGVTGNSKTIGYKYNENGIRTQKTVGETTTTYMLNDTGRVDYQTDGTDSLYFRYNSDDTLIGFEYNNGTTTVDYYYVKNLQGDVISILDNTGAEVVSYIYDAWGKVLSTSGSAAATIGVINPFRYRSYYYDTETDLYYLQSRYYDPNTGRFINADDTSVLQVAQGELLGANLFAYCGNKPIDECDPKGFYNRTAAFEYFLKWCNKRNPFFYSYRVNDCANFVSQCLFYGAFMKMNKIWHSYQKFNYSKYYFKLRSRFDEKYWYDWNVSEAWNTVVFQYVYFRDSNLIKSKITIDSVDKIKNVIKRKIVKVMDIIYFYQNADNVPDHVGVISRINNNMLCYGAHSDECDFRELKYFFKKYPSGKVRIFTIK